MSRIKVKHVLSRDDWGKPKDGSSNWIEYWKKHTKFPLQDFCRDCGSKVGGENLLGAHIKKVDAKDESIYIVPTCKSCNTKGASDCHEFECDERILVPANKDNL